MAQRGINKVIIVGHLGQDPDVKATPQGQTVTRLSIATSESWKDKNTGKINEKTEWHRVVMFGPIADIAAAHLIKGSQVYIEGKLHTRKWQDQQGREMWSTEIVVDSFSGVLQMLGGKPAESSPNRPPQTPIDQYDNDIPF